MATVAVQFLYLTGLKRQIFRNGRLSGSWDPQGRRSAAWTEVPMKAIIAEDGCPGFSATVLLDITEIGKDFQWGVRLDTPAAANVWGIPTEVPSAERVDRLRSFKLAPVRGSQQERFFFTYARRLGARKVFSHGHRINPALRFAVWAPNAQKVEVVFADKTRGYIDDQGKGIDPMRPVLRLTKQAEGIWESEILPGYDSYEGLAYMYRIQNAQGRIVYRGDLFSRVQAGRGAVDPKTGNWNGDPATLEGTKSCSLIMSLDTVSRDFETLSEQSPVRIPEAEFWTDEFTPGLTVPTRVEDLIIYELHIGSLGYGSPGPGNLSHAMALLPHLSDLGVNAVELLPMSEFSGIGWGYGDSHHFVIEATSGGRDQYKHFIRECHRRGIAVIQDVVYNHWDGNAERAQWQFDSEAPEQNIYYWYEGRSSDYSFPEGGYVDNGSSGFSPRYWEEMVRHVFVSSAAAFLEECHVDGLRVDLTQAMHRDNALHADGRGVGSANQYGAKTLREWSRTLRLIRSNVMLIAEDHSDWELITQVPELGGLGFDATWFAAFYHNLIGDSDMAGGRARLLKYAGLGDGRDLDLSQFASVLNSSQYNKVVYHESHDEAGNAGGSMRTLPCAVNRAALLGATREFAEARSRVAFGLSLLSAGSPMFFMGEEIGAQKPYRYDNFVMQREDILGERTGNGARLFRFYQDAIRFRRRHPSTRSRNIDILHVNGEARIIAFLRRSGNDLLLVVASLKDQSFPQYVIQSDASRLPDGNWREQFNSDAALYGGQNVGNGGADVGVSNGRIQISIPANGYVAFLRI